jgi:hypothetical protein
MASEAAPPCRVPVPTVVPETLNVMIPVGVFSRLMEELAVAKSVVVRYAPTGSGVIDLTAVAVGFSWMVSG